ncbi:hypothetical protein TWF225_004292 [Orbilia oligospora]|uniref:3-ketoacyl-CoA thiolase with broad chain length specificity n=1 Tax=Orbilia oligospora TaxID=2813651 RepID=A0A7C8JXE8_ORBOL|nr:hypothetical protein TWF751_004109 [Orbilia oligospora]KAF3187132.1 hypothetical protein TWF225_004292 [Orbilia oligospora]KAF3258589.1 hypothetical protein TWF217_005366 [Orbilia oligospora]KAF3267012.1 hypothetical protein TWF128_009975 [Orbilia oligospora]KAF3295455.1 hypothetical protein TWF132_001504 [Orbilia oligospora]
MADRLKNVLNHLNPGVSSGRAAVLSKNPDDIVITYATRTALAKGGKGSFKDTPLENLLLQLLQGVIKNSNIDPVLVEDIACGNVAGTNMANKIRMAALTAGFPNTTAAHIVNRFCSSGLLAIQDIAQQIAGGSIDIGIAIGAESMTENSKIRDPFSASAEISANQEAEDCKQPMGQTSENVGKDFGITREMQDRYAAESYKRAEVAQKAGWFNDEILPITTVVVDPKTGEKKTVTVTADEGPRHGTTFESLSKIRPAFPQFGDKSTGGNSSQVTDGAAALLLMKRSTAQKLGQPILAKYVYSTVVGLAPRIMGIGPSVAIPKLLSKLNLTIKDIDVVELNEAFASMAVYCLNKLEIPHEIMNIRGGAIALGHPLGATGARQVVTGLSECRRTGKKLLLTSMCIGSGQGMAGLFVNEA